MSKRVLLSIGGGVLLLGAATVIWGDRVLLHLMQQRVIASVSGAVFDDFSNGLDVVLCGAGSPIPDPRRSGPCVAVIADGKVRVFDAGSGAARNLLARGIGPGRITDVFLTHYHSDYIDGLGELFMQRWAGGPHDTPVPVHGPQGVTAVVDGFNAAYALDNGYRVAHHGAAILPPSGAGGLARPFAAPAAGERRVVLEDEDLVVTAVSVAHPPIAPAVAYRIDYRGRSVVISGDTVKSDALIALAEGADLLLHEALAPQLVDVMTAGTIEAGVPHMTQITHDIHNYHTTPVEAAEVAAAAGVGHLLYYHVVPALPLKRLETLFVEGADAVYTGGISVGRDGTWVSLPAGSDDIRLGRR